MNTCTVTTGFFVLGRCGRPAVMTCGCQRLVCAEHVTFGNMCPECATAQGYPADDPYNPVWTSGYRRAYYRRSAHQYHDTTWYASFDHHDRGGFDPGYASNPDFADDGGSGWVDS